MKITFEGSYKEIRAEMISFLESMTLPDEVIEENTFNRPDRLRLPDPDILAKNIRDLRKSMRMIQEDFGSYLGLTKHAATTVSNWEREKQVPPEDILYKLADLLGVDLHELTHTPNLVEQLSQDALAKLMS